jgi:hypothetical protein
MEIPMRELTIPCEGGDIVMQINDDGVSTHCVDMKKLDADLAAIDAQRFSLPEDDADLSAHQWETPLGREIGSLFAAIDAGQEYD